MMVWPPACHLNYNSNGNNLLTIRPLINRLEKVYDKSIKKNNDTYNKDNR